MRFYNVVFILLTVVAIEVSCVPECGKEIHGDANSDGNFPWSIYLTVGTTPGRIFSHCAGTLINPSVVISSANCFYNEILSTTIDANSLTALAMGSYMEPTPQEVKVKSIHIANGYQGSRGFYEKNIAWLTLQHRFNLTSTVRPVCIDFDNQHESEDLQVGRVGKIMQRLPTSMQKPNIFPPWPDHITFISRTECASEIPKEFRSFLTTDRFCVRYPPGTRFTSYLSGTGVYFYSDGHWYFRGILNSAFFSPDSRRAYPEGPLIFTNVGRFVDETKCGKVTRPVTPTIKGGLRAELGGFPWHVVIYRKNSTGYHDQICGGSLISSNVVVSAAHCVYDDRIRQKMDAINFVVAAGKHYRSYNWPEIFVQKSLVETIHISSRYYGIAGLYTGDIAWLILQSPFNVTPFVTPICLHSNYQYETEQLRIGQSGKVARWGSIADGSGSNKLRQMNVPFIAHDECVSSLSERFRSYVTFDKFCAGSLNGTMLCEGDSGGGLVFERDGRWYLRGIVSLNPQGGISCDTNSYTVFTDVGLFSNELYEFTNITTDDII